MTDQDKEDIIMEFQSLLQDLLHMPYSEFKRHFGNLAVDVYKAIENKNQDMQTLKETDECITVILKEIVKMRSPLYKALNEE